MSLRFILRIFASFFLIATMLGGSQSYAQDEAVPAATPIIENDDLETSDALEPTEPEIKTTSAKSSATLSSSAISFSISGIVTNDRGIPLVGAKVCADFYSSAGFFLCVQTGSGGSYSISNVPSNYGYIISSADGHWRDSVVIDKLEANIKVDMQLDAVIYTTLTGSVTDDAGSPLAGAEVCAWSARGGEVVLDICVLTDSTGAYAIDDVPDADGYVRVFLKGFWTSADYGFGPGWRFTIDPIVLNRIAEFFSITGQVSDDGNSLMEGVQVCASVYGASFDNCVSTSTDGSYTIQNVPNGYGTVTASAEGYFDSQEEFGSSGDNIISDHVLHRITYFSISGSITDETGKHLVGIRVCRTLPFLGGRICTTTNAEGEYLFAAQVGGSFTKIVSEDRAWSFSSDLFLLNKDTRTDLVATPKEIDPNTITVAGRVVDRNGNPINVFTLCFEVEGSKFGDDCVTSIDESNEFDEPLGWGHIMLFAQGCPHVYVVTYEGVRETDWTPGRNDLGTFMMDCEAGVAPITTSIVSGKVTYLDGSPAAGVTVSLTSEVAASRLFAFATSGYTTTTTADGTYAFSDVIDGSYTISAAAGPGFGDKQQITVAGEDVTANLVLRYSNVSVAGTVKDKDGQPVAGARVCLNQVCVDTDANGVYALGPENGPIGEHTISASADGFAPQSQPLSILGDANTMSVNFQLVAAVGTETPTETPTSTAPATETPTSTAPATEEPTGTVVPTGTASTTPDGSGTTTPGDSGSDGVTSLPSTGTGTMNGTLVIAAMLAIAATSLMLAGGLAVRQRRG